MTFKIIKNKHMKNTLFYFIAALILILSFSCNEITDVGYDILPDKDKLNLKVTDTLTIDVHTYLMDTIAVDKVPSVLLGQYSDPYTGTSNAGFVMQFTMAGYPVFSDSLIADSVVLTLPYTSASQKSYGDTTAQQLIAVYELTKALRVDTSYYSTLNPAELHAGELLGTHTFTPFPATDTINGKVNRMHITLSAELAEKFLRADGNVFASGDNFRDFFKGVYVKSVEGDAIVKYDVNENTLLTVCYHYPSSDTTARYWEATANSNHCARFNLFEHDYSQTSFYDKLNDDNMPEDSVAYIQAMGGLRLKVNIPYIDELSKLGNISIYRAELIIKAVPKEYSLEWSYPAIDNLIITGVGTDSEYFLLPEYISDNQYLAVSYSDDNEYHFDIGYHVKNIIDGVIENNGFYIFSSAGSFNLGRSIVTTGSNSDNIKLVVTYVDLEN